MQWYLASLAMLLVMAGVGVLTGGLFIPWLPARMQPPARIFLALPLGWSLLTLVATLLGWFGPGYARCHATLLTALLAAAGAWTDRHGLRRAGGDSLRLAAFCVLASFPVLGPLARRGAFNLYNDSIFYDCHALWLQQHRFLEYARTDGGHPAWGTLVVFQQTHLRMGASFLLGWTQAAFGLAWPHEIYPAVAGLAMICAALGVGAALLAAFPGRWVEAWLTALATAVTVNGFVFGAANGFLPQTCGLAFAAAAFGLRSLELGRRAERGGRSPWRTGVPLAVCAAASMYCYWELLPLLGPALAASYLLPWPGRSALAWGDAWRRARVPLLAWVLLVNLEWVRAVQGILLNLTALAAHPVAWTFWDYPAHALGLKSSPWERSRWITGDASAGLLLAGCATVVLWLLVMVGSQAPRFWRHWLSPSRRVLARWGWRPLVPALVWSGMCALLFLYFREVVPSPWHGQRQGMWPDGTGQSWNQYKVANWISFAVVGLAAAATTGLAARARSFLGRGACVGLLVLWCGTGLGWNYLVVKRRGERLLTDTGFRRDPLDACLAMRQVLDAVPPGDWIYLDWPPDDGAGQKYRQLMTYFLYDHPLAAAWDDDGYLAPYVTSEDARRTEADCQWVLRYRRPTVLPTGETFALGGLTLERRDR